MNLDFSSTRKRTSVTTPDLATLLAETSAVQAASPTALAQTRLHAITTASNDDDPRISMFAHDRVAAFYTQTIARFAEIESAIFIPRQSL